MTTMENDEDNDLLKSWETPSGILFELHDCKDHDELLIIDDSESDADSDGNIVTLFSVADLDEVTKVLTEARAMMASRRP
jgi:hypothetical protein